MTSLYDNHDTQWTKGLLDTFLDLERHTLLYLQAVRVDVYHTGYLGKTSDIAIGDISDMHLPIERYHVVFAKYGTNEIDVDGEKLLLMRAEDIYAKYAD